LTEATDSQPGQQVLMSDKLRLSDVRWGVFTIESLPCGLSSRGDAVIRNPAFATLGHELNKSTRNEAFDRFGAGSIYIQLGISFAEKISLKRTLLSDSQWARADEGFPFSLFVKLSVLEPIFPAIHFILWRAPLLICLDIRSANPVSKSTRRGAAP